MLENFTSKSSHTGGETARRVPARHGVRPGVRVHAVGSGGSHQELRQASHRQPEEELHDDAAQGGRLLSPQQHHAQGKSVTVTTSLIFRFV